jgi:hypothetical protein
MVNQYCHQSVDTKYFEVMNTDVNTALSLRSAAQEHAPPA